MALSDDQISGYKQAVGKKNTGSQPSGQVMKNAESTSLGRNIRNRATSTSGASAVKGGSRARGSMEGLQAGSSTLIQMSGSGYDAKKNQVARRPKPPKDLRGVRNTSKISSSMSSVYDYSGRGQKNSSKARMSKITRLNKML